MSVAVVWFSNSLRVHDNPALTCAYESEDVEFILPIYIFEEEIDNRSTRSMGEQRLRFQFDCVEDLHQNLKHKLDLDLQIFSGNSLDIFESIMEQLMAYQVVLLSEYSTNPHCKKQLQLVEKNLINTNGNWSSKSIPSCQTILDIESIVESSGYRPPKSMKDMVKLFNQEFADFDIVNNVATFISSQRSDSRKIIHWTSLDSSKEADLLMVMDNEIVKIPGMIESHNLENGTHVQIERIGYGVIAANNQIIFTHD